MKNRTNANRDDYCLLLKSNLSLPFGAISYNASEYEYGYVLLGDQVMYHNNNSAVVQSSVRFANPRCPTIPWLKSNLK